MAAGPSPRWPSLPDPPTALIGRDAELGNIAAQLCDRGTRLLTLLGPGGVGKTRLALAAAARVEGRFAHGASFVSLAPLADPAELGPGIAVALGVPIQGRATPTEALLRFLAGREILLVLDNFEHLLAGVTLPADLLARCPGLTILATSREPLRVAAERLYAVDPLAVPPEGDAPLPGDQRYPSVALFLDRAVAHDPDFRLDRRSAPHIHHVCRRLDGLPLALELAAARSGCSRRTSWPNDSTTRWLCSRAAREMRLHASEPCEPRSTGATSCSAMPSDARSVAWRCSRAASSSRWPSR